MLPKIQRIGTDRFGEIMKNGRTVRSSVLYTRFEPNTIKRFAVSVPKKVEKSAVKRHFIKRRVMAAIREESVHFPSGDYIIFVTSEMKGSTLPVLKELLEDLGKRVALR